ncbi:MAG: 16S rRNA (uracil(1498)-N(3))-methyltransferase [Lachnospiraceae bacterium]|nr:16S rRNA (uracil(1498)-N(3))-methyltransferase [Candidatus Merdinaster equi]
MYQFFVDRSQINIEDKRVMITGDNYNHLINVLRIKPGEEFAVSDGEDGKEYRCALLEGGCDAAGESALCEIRFIKEADNELPVRVHLYQGLPKSDKMELIIQKMVELGVYEIIPVNMSRCVMKLDDKKVKSRVERWNSISEAAAKQSKRKIIPQVSQPLSFKQAVNDVLQKGMDIKLVPYELAEGMEATRNILGNIEADKDIAVIIGPEGGIAENEIALATENGFEIITLGKRILRTETAGMAIMSVIAYLTEGKG